MRLGTAIFLVSAAALLFQVAQTRLFSATLGYHLTYLVISVALLGVGAGGTASALFDAGPRRPPTSALAAAVGASALLTLVAETRLDPLAHGVAPAILVAYVFGSLPFVFASWLVVRALREHPTASGELYAADLAGAAVGGLAGYLAIPALGVQALYGLSGLLAAAAVPPLLRPEGAVRAVTLRAAAPLAGVIGLVALSAWGDTLAPPRVGPNRAVDAFSPSVVHEVGRWDPLARVDVFRFEDPTGAYRFVMAPGYAGERPAALSMLLDFDAATPILAGGSAIRALEASILSAPYELVDRPRVLVIGPGGGIDIHTALARGASEVVAVEVNRTVVDLMRGRYAAYSGAVYDDLRVTIAVDEARSFVRRSTDRFDAIVMTVVDSWAALASGSYALTESYLYTEEAFADYLAHLAPGGVFAVGRWYREPPVEMLRTAQVAARGLRNSGIREAERHLLVLRHRGFGLLLVRPAPFDSAAVAAVRRFAQTHGFAVAYDPLAPTSPFADALASDVAPATDDRPFFFHGDAAADGGPETHIPVAYAILFLALVSSFVLSYVAVLTPLRRRLRGVRDRSLFRSGTAYALALGCGFIGAEIVLLQRLTLYLGQPALALSVGVAALLSGAALGAALSRRLPGQARAAAVSSAVALLAVFAGFGAVSDATLPWPLAARVGVATLGSFAIGVPLGSVFPRVVSAMAASDPRLVSWVWAVNGSASVIGSILAVVLAMNAGFTAVALVATACYAGVALVRVRPARLEPTLARAS